MENSVIRYKGDLDRKMTQLYVLNTLIQRAEFGNLAMYSNVV